MALSLSCCSLAVGLLALFLALSPTLACNGDMTPDHDVLAGSPLVLNCSLRQPYYRLDKEIYEVNSSLIRFKFRQRYLPLSNVRLLDELTAQYRLESSDVADSGTYYCFLHIPKVKNVSLCLSNVSVGYPPRPVSNFTCISMHYMNLTCSWEPAYNPVRTTYTLIDKLYSFYSDISFPCPIVLSPTSCQWTFNSSPPYRKQPRFFKYQLTGTNSLGTLVENFTVPHYEIVLPGPPFNISTVAVGRESVSLAWYPPIDMFLEGDFAPGLLYQLQYKSMREGTKESWRVVKVGVNDFAYNLTGLVPHTPYIIRVRCRSGVVPKDTSKILWSKFTSTTILTLPDVPYLAPEMSPDVFETSRAEQRTITLYWKPIAPSFHNGPNFHYVVRCGNLSDNTTANHYSFLFFNSSQSYSFLVYAGNSVGVSSNISSISVPPISNTPPLPQDFTVVSKGGGVYDLRWQAPMDHFIQHFTVVWCANLRPRPFSCNGNMNWQHVNPEVRQHRLILPDEMINYQFAISLTVQGISSGLLWASCVIPITGVLPKVTQVYLNLPHKPRDATTLRFQWQLDCNAQRELVKEFRISYCDTLGKGKPCYSSMHVLRLRNSTLKSYDLTGLRPYTLYRVTLSVLSDMGYSEESDPLELRTLSAAPSGPPLDITLLNISSTSMSLAWKPPLFPNGIVTSYKIKYGSNMDIIEVNSSIPEEDSYTEVPPPPEVIHTEIFKNVIPFTNYSIRISACVNNDCSPFSEPLFVLTDIAAPEKMDPPRIEVLNMTYHKIRLTWKPPEIPNGPIDQYTLAYEWNDDDDNNSFNASNQHQMVLPGTQTSVNLTLQCPSETTKFFFVIWAANLKSPFSFLEGPPSEPVHSAACFPPLVPDPSGMSLALLAGAIVGSFLCLALLALALYTSARWMKNKMDHLKAIKVQLPSSLDDAHGYENLKRGIFFRKENPVPNKKVMTYGRLSSEEKDVKERHSSGHSQYSNTSTEELLQKKTCHLGSHNVSLDSQDYGKDSCHRVSSDSGAETDTPPSPDSVPAPRLAPSADSGLDTRPSDELGLAYLSNLANSEPSVADLSFSSPSPVAPYSKFGLARSLNNVVTLPSPDAPGYSKVTQPYSRFGRIPQPNHSTYISFAAILHDNQMGTKVQECPESIAKSPVKTPPTPPSYSKCEVKPTTSGYVSHPVAAEMLSVPSLPEEVEDEEDMLEEPAVNKPLVHPPYIPHNSSLLLMHQKPSVDYVPTNEHCMSSENV